MCACSAELFGLSSMQLAVVAVAAVAAILASLGTWFRPAVDSAARHEVGQYPRRAHRLTMAGNRLILLAALAGVALIFALCGKLATLGTLGLGLGNLKRGLLIALIAAGVALVLSLLALWIERARAEERVRTWTWGRQLTAGVLEAVATGLLLRGYLLFLLVPAHVGLAILVVASLDGMLAAPTRHMGATLGAFIGALGLAAIAVLTGSVYYSIFVHWLLLGLFARFPAETVPYGVARVT